MRKINATFAIEELETGGAMLPFDDSRIHHLKTAHPELERLGIRADSY
jgi:hypothetical protein